MRGREGEVGGKVRSGRKDVVHQACLHMYIGCACLHTQYMYVRGCAYIHT